MEPVSSIDGASSTPGLVESLLNLSVRFRLRNQAESMQVSAIKAFSLMSHQEARGLSPDPLLVRMAVLRIADAKYLKGDHQCADSLLKFVLKQDSLRMPSSYSEAVSKCLASAKSGSKSELECNTLLKNSAPLVVHELAALNSLRFSSTYDRKEYLVLVDDRDLSRLGIGSWESRNATHTDSQLYNPSKQSLLRRSWNFIFDTESLFAAGDLALALLAAETVGIVVNAAAAGMAIVGRIYGTLTGKKLGLGFLAMGGVSAISAVSVLVNSIRQYGSDFIAIGSPEPRQLLCSALAFGAWTVANFLAGLREGKPKVKNSNFLLNHQSWFCIGSIFATNASPIPALIFGLALFQSFRGPPTDTPEVELNLKGFVSKHLSPSRLRGFAYLMGAFMIAKTNPAFVIPYALWMLGNLAFDDRSLNQSLKKDLIALIGR